MIIWKNNKLPSFYVFLYKLMREKTENPLYVNYNIIRDIFKRRLHNIPLIYHHLILKEMEELGLIKRIERKPNLRYELIGKDVHRLLFKYEDILF